MVGETLLVATMAPDVELISVKLVKQEPGYEINKKSSDCDTVPVKETEFALFRRRYNRYNRQSRYRISFPCVAWNICEPR